MGIQRCELVYDNPAATYYAGQTLSGRLEIQLDSPKKYRGIKIQFTGVGKVQWREGGSRRRRRRNFTATQKHFSFEYFLAGSNSGKLNVGNFYHGLKNARRDTQELPPGKHELPFQCTLPPNLPTSFEGKFGHVRYTIKVSINRPWKFDNNYKFAFTVLSPYDLNQNPALKDSVNDYSSSTFSFIPFFCIKSSPLTIHVNIPCSGFVPGQIIPVRISCDNASSKTIDNFKILLFQDVKYNANSPWSKERRHKQDVANLTTNQGVIPGESKIFEEKMTVPPLPASDLLNCGLIDIEYTLSIRANGGGCCFTPPTMKIPIKIGTMPIKERITQLQGGVHSLPTTQMVQSDVAYGSITQEVPQTVPSTVPTEYSAFYPTKTAPTTVPAYAMPIQSGATTSHPNVSTVPSYAMPIQPSPAITSSSLVDIGFNAPDPGFNPPMYPPTYEESQYRAATIQEQDDNEFTNVGTQGFAPKYPVFNFPNT